MQHELFGRRSESSTTYAIQLSKVLLDTLHFKIFILLIYVYLHIQILSVRLIN